MAKVLVVDDDSTVLIFICTLLNDEGHETIPFKDGTQVVEYFNDPRNDIPDLIVSDVTMPQMDGYTLHTTLQQDKRTRHIPTIILTAKGKLASAFKASNNIVAFLEKPFDMVKFRETVRKALPKGAH